MTGPPVPSALGRNLQSPTGFLKMMRRVPLILLLTISAALALSAPAFASSGLEVGIADDGVTQRTPSRATKRAGRPPRMQSAAQSRCTVDSPGFITPR